MVHRNPLYFKLVIVVLGLAWPLLSKLGLGRLPGDIVIERENFTLYFPIVTSLLVSVLPASCSGSSTGERFAR